MGSIEQEEEGTYLTQPLLALRRDRLLAFSLTLAGQFKPFHNCAQSSIKLRIFTIISLILFIIRCAVIIVPIPVALV